MDGNTHTTERIIRCALEVHRRLGPGLLESVYEAALCVELSANEIPFQRQVPIPLVYRDEIISEHRIDLIVEDEVIVEIRSVERFAPVHRAQLLTYLRVKSLRVGLLLNFNGPR
jgi:GxxExxY protein